MMMSSKYEEDKIESALVSAIRLRRYWMSQGLSEEKAIEKAIDQAVGMCVTSGIRICQLRRAFEELALVCPRFISALKVKNK